MSVSEPQASVVVRTYNSERTLAACLDSLRRQTVVPEIIVVDSGSSDGSLTIADRRADQIVQLSREAFSYGRSLNRGAAVARAPITFAVSSHCVIPRDDWVELSLHHYVRSDVAATNGQVTYPDGSPLRAALYLVAGMEVRNPFWGFSNHASSWRADVWRRIPFDESLVACEDFEWSDRVMAVGHTIVFDPALTVSGHHRITQGPRALYRRSYREFLALATCRGLEPPRLRDAVAEWWCQHPPGTKAHRQWLSPYRLAVIGGRYRAGRTLRTDGQRRKSEVGRISAPRAHRRLDSPDQ